MRGIRILAVFVGLIIDLALSVVWSIVFSIGLILYLTQRPGHHASFSVPEIHALLRTVPVMLINTAAGGGTALIGGFVTGWVAKTDRGKNASALAIVELVVSLPFLVLMMNGYPAWYPLAGCIVTVALTLLGGYAANVILSEKSSPVPPIS